MATDRPPDYWGAMTPPEPHGGRPLAHRRMVGLIIAAVIAGVIVSALVLTPEPTRARTVDHRCLALQQQYRTAVANGGDPSVVVPNLLADHCPLPPGQ